MPFPTVLRPGRPAAAPRIASPIPPRIARRVSRGLASLALLGTASAASLLGSAPGRAEAAPAAPASCTGPASGTWIRVVTEGVRSGSGAIVITLYADDSSRFLAHHGSLYLGRVKATAGSTDGCIFVPHPGVYAIAIYHDENNNEKFDRSSIGLPAEGYGFSNNPSTLLGLPSFDSVRLNVMRSGLTSHIHIKYP